MLNIIEEQSTTIKELMDDNQQLKDELNRLKGEQGKPNIKPGKANKDISSEKERKATVLERKAQRAKKQSVKIDIEEKVYIKDKGQLPKDARFLRFEELISQDIKLLRCNTKYLLEVYYSPSKNKTYRAETPKAHTGYFSTGTKSLVQVLTHVCDVTNSKLLQLLNTCDISISSSSISNILLENKDLFVKEKQDILKAGLSNSFCGADSTCSKEKGKRLYTQIICNEYFTIFSSMPSKSRLDIISVLQGEPENGILYSYNETAKTLLRHFKVSQSDREKLNLLFGKTNKSTTRTELDRAIQTHIPELKAKKNMYKRVCESLAIGHYHEQNDYPVVKTLLTDDAPEYQKIALLQQALCWVHDARAYKKLTPFIDIHNRALNGFMKKYWHFYGKLLKYKTSPTPEQKQKLERGFEKLFSAKTNYSALDRRIEKTYANKQKLLAVLTNPGLPLHNNASELGARRVVVKRDISLHTMGNDGTKVKDAVMSIIETAKKLKVNYIEYLNDLINRDNYMPRLSRLILDSS